MDREDVAVLERDTVAAVAPPEMMEIGGWLVPLDNGTIGRAKSAAPLRHDVGPDALGEIEDAYRSRGLKPAFRIADVPSLAPVCAELTRRGFAPQQPTIFKTGSVAALAAFSHAPARVLETPDAAWAGVFLGDGFDPADGAHRVQALTRSPGAIYGAAGQGGATHAVGVMSFGARWVGIHGMRTAPGHRGQGHARAILAALGRVALACGRGQVFLQVEEANPARRIYRAAGFAPIWRYHYWR
ncbi:MAG TPA: GNAT family N-acetyltransferase [Phenylobacterium sp.]|nr:GNAT family N-acetyltransferase [Phenylobacterium sp.]